MKKETSLARESARLQGAPVILTAAARFLAVLTGVALSQAALRPNSMGGSH